MKQSLAKGIVYLPLTIYTYEYAWCNLDDYLTLPLNDE